MGDKRFADVTLVAPDGRHIEYLKVDTLRELFPLKTCIVGYHEGIQFQFALQNVKNLNQFQTKTR